MHSTLRTELRGTQRIFELLRSQPRLRPAKRSTKTVREFGQQTCLRNKAGSGSKPEADRSSNLPEKRDDNTPSFQPRKAADLEAQIKFWANHYSEKGEGQVWDSISKKDDSGNRELLPQVKNDLAEIEKWISQNGTPGSFPFAIKIDNGSIRSLTPEEVQQEIKERRDRPSGGGQPEGDAQDQHGISASHLPHDSSFASLVKVIDPLQSNEQKGKEETDNVQNREGDSPPGENDVPSVKYYGSSTARRQRAQRSREKAVTYPVPEWFSDRNVLLWRDNQLNHAQPLSVTSVLEEKPEQNQTAHTLSHATQSMAAMAELATKSTDQKTFPASDKERAFSPGGNDSSDSPNGDPNSATSPSNGPVVSTSVPVPEYAINDAQFNELMLTAEGKLRPPKSDSSLKDPRGIRGHLTIHYTASNGEVFLDFIVQEIARRLHCDLLTLDAQDISALISKADIDPMIASEAKMLSYEVYGGIYDAVQPKSTSQIVEEDEDADEDEDDESGPSMPFKGIAIDLGNMFNNKSTRRFPPPFGSKGFISDMRGLGGMMVAGEHSKPHSHIFSAIVESVLSSLRDKRKKSNAEAFVKEDKMTSEKMDGDSSVSSNNAKDPLIIQIKDLKNIQDTSIGKQFVLQLIEQVERRRASGEAIMLVGTESSRDDASAYSKKRIDSIQDTDSDALDTVTVITPTKSGSTDFARDRIRRISTVNARHLWETLQSKNVAVSNLRPGFWITDFFETLDPTDQIALSSKFWSLSHVQRLAAVLASSEMSGSARPIAEATRVIDSSDKTKYDWSERVKPSKSKDDKSESELTTKDRIAKIREKATRHEKKLMGGVIEPSKMSTTFQDIHIPPETVDALQTLTTLNMIRPDAFKYGVLASDRIPGLMLYGPPGTGKTLAAKAVARESGATMLEVSAADINDMYVGEGEKNVKALFSLAKKLSPCVVFLDEADAMFSARSQQGHRVSQRELLNQFLKEWDGMSNDSGSAFIMVATNRPMDLDDAVLRRLPRRLLVDLPTEKDRLEILKIHLRHENLAEDVDLASLAKRTPFYSGSDLKNVAVSAALNAVREENDTAKKYVGEVPYRYPEMRTLTAQHFDKALAEISASISEDMSSLKEIKKFDEQYGDKRGKKRKAPKWGFKTAAEADKVLDTIKVRSEANA